MHTFSGKWITNDEFFALSPGNVFHRQLEPVSLPCEEHRDRHILFRKTFTVNNGFKSAKIYISADDYYKLYINGVFAAQGPAPSYHFRYNYNCIDVSGCLQDGENTIAVHTLYQGLINRVWQSGDNRHGLIIDLEIDGKTVIQSDESFKTQLHSAYREIGTVGYNTQFSEEYDSRAPEVGFASPDFDDSRWEYAKINPSDDHKPVYQKSKMLVFESISPKLTKMIENNVLFVDFGSTYVGYLDMKAYGKDGDTVIIRCGQELDSEGRVRYKMRCNCTYEETFILKDGESVLDQFDYKSFRYAEIIFPDGVKVSDIRFNARHYPFELKVKMREDFAGDEKLRAIWNLCINTQKYGIQEVIQDCMDREKGFYLGDGCYTAITNYILTGDDSMVRKLIDDAFETSFITDGLVTCMDCSFMQEIAEYPLILVYTVLWHYNLSGDAEYLKNNYKKVISLLETYRKNYETDNILSNLDKWCVVEWPKNYQDGYAVDIREGKVCTEPHISINAYYIAAVMTANRIAEISNEEPYRDEQVLKDSFVKMFYDEEKELFRDGANTDHISVVGNSFAFAFGLCPNARCEKKILDMIAERNISAFSLFCTFPVMSAIARMGRDDILKRALLDEGAWLRMLREGATTTFEGWGKDAKWNTSLFHLTFSYAAVFLADVDVGKILSIQPHVY